MKDLFFQIIRIAIGVKDGLQFIPSEDDWQACYDMALKQTLIGISFAGVNRLPAEQRPPRSLYLKWMGKVAKIQMQNEKINETAVRTREALSNAGFYCCMLKGQGVAQLYNSELVMLRQSGDIDMWIVPKEKMNIKNRRKKIRDFVNNVAPKSTILYHQVGIHLKNNVKFEIHFTPSWMNSPIKNWRLQRWFEGQIDCVMHHEVELTNGKKIPAPTQTFNEVFILQHIYRHLFGEGIGLRQVMDYYFVLMHSNADNRTELVKTLRHLGLLRFAHALMWVMGELFAMPRERMICEPNEKEGRFILEEMMIAGNFGHYDERIDRSKTTLLQLFLMRTSRNLRFISYYPEEVICTPIFKIWHFTCRKLHII